MQSLYIYAAFEDVCAFCLRTRRSGYKRKRGVLNKEKEGCWIKRKKGVGVRGAETPYYYFKCVSSCYR